MTSATLPNVPAPVRTGKRRGRKPFLTLYPDTVRATIKQITADSQLKLVPSPTGSYARASIHGRTVAYIVPGQRGVRVLFSGTVADAPKRVRETAFLHQLQTGQFSATVKPGDDKKAAAVTTLLQFLAAHVPPLTTDTEG